jgi:hypothetical protein
MIQLDHIIVFCSSGAPEATALRDQGLVDASGQVHVGQGTANRRFSFANAFLELLWVEDETEARGGEVQATQLWERWHGRSSGLCPFGLAFRPGADAAEQPPFSTWSNRPSYLPTGFSIEVGSEIKPTEPLLFFLPFVKGRRGPPSESTDHPAGVSELVDLRLYLPQAAHPSDAILKLVSTGLVSINTASEYCMELKFLGSRLEPIDLRPRLPLVFLPQTNARK